jgi:hypothetical protein
MAEEEEVGGRKIPQTIFAKRVYNVATLWYNTSVRATAHETPTGNGEQGRSEMMREITASQWNRDQGTAYLFVEIGGGELRRVQHYSNETGWITTGNGDYFNQRSYLICGSETLYIVENDAERVACENDLRDKLIAKRERFLTRA